MSLDAGAVEDLLDDLASLPQLGGWVRSAACRGEAELFTTFPASTTAAERVARICDACPVRATCEEYAARFDVDGVWAGTWHNTSTGTTTGPVDQRAAVRPAVPCGTYGGYRRHRRAGEPACEPCRAANTAQARRYTNEQRDLRSVDRKGVQMMNTTGATA